MVCEFASDFFLVFSVATRKSIMESSKKQYITTIKLYNSVLNNLITLEQNQTVFCLNLNNYKKINFALKKNTCQISKEIIDLGVKKRGEYVAPESTQISPMKGSLV